MKCFSIYSTLKTIKSLRPLEKCFPTCNIILKCLTSDLNELCISMRKRPQLLNYTTCLNHGIQIDFFQSSSTRMSPTRSKLGYPSSMPKRFSKRRKNKESKVVTKVMCSMATWLKCNILVVAPMQRRSPLKKEVAILYMCTNTTSIHFSSNLGILHSNRHFHSPPW